MDYKLNEFKIYCLDQKYNEYIKLMIKIQDHIYNLYSKYLISNNDKNIYTNNLYELQQRINYKYKILMKMFSIDNNKSKNILFIDNETDIEYIEKYDKELNLPKKILDIFITDISSDKYNKINNDILLEQIYTLFIEYIHINNINNDDMEIYKNILDPFDTIKDDILNLMKNIGIPNKKIIDVIKLMTNKYFNIDYRLEFFNNIFISYSYYIEKNIIITYDDNELINNKIDSLMNKKIFLRKNIDITGTFSEKYKKDELIYNNYQLYIKIKSKTWLILNGFIKQDQLLFSTKTNNLYDKISIILYNKFIDLDKKINNNDTFKKKYIKYIDLHELISMSNQKLLIYIDNKYNRFVEINNRSFPNLMKDFVNKISNITYIYDTIKLLLLGSEDNINIAGSLFSLLKDKKSNDSFNMISDIIYNNLIFIQQVKLKKVQYTLKTELSKLSELSIESVDLKKQLALNKNIPSSVKSLTLEKINEMKLNNNDYYKQYVYVKSILQFPWKSNDNNNDIFYELNRNIDSAKKFILDTEKALFTTTYGHIKAKEQLILLLSKWITNPNSNGSAISLFGPPGVGKTLLAKSLSSVLKLPFVHITLGGQNDGEILHGHGYTYSGAQPGLIIKKMIEAGSSRCIMYFDELDKSTTKHGSINEIMSILIHLTDPNMNKTFQDRFFQGIDFPLDKVIFITSYNDRDKIDPILLDRFIELEVKPYNIKDKMNIIDNFIIKELKENIGIKQDIKYNINDMKQIIEEYTNEAGVRDIKRKLELILMKINKSILLNDSYNNQDIILNYDYMIDLLDDNNKYKPKKLPDEDSIGIINGLYATTTGSGGIVNIQIFPQYISDNNNFNIKLTGSLGDVMKESINVAYTTAVNYINKHKSKYNIECVTEYIKKTYPYGFHVHTPAGATPKDGPSAGCAFTIAFISRILNKKFKRDVAMTGEIDLNNNVTKIGGLEFKMIGAKQAGIKLVLISSENDEDIKEIKKNYPDLLDDNFKYKLINVLEDAVKESLLN